MFGFSESRRSDRGWVFYFPYTRIFNGEKWQRCFTRAFSTETTRNVRSITSRGFVEQQPLAERYPAAFTQDMLLPCLKHPKWCHTEGLSQKCCLPPAHKDPGATNAM